MSQHRVLEKMTVPRIVSMKAEKRKITALTSYDATLASIVDSAGLDIILVGDSASMVLGGNADTLPITLDEMISLTRWVRRGVKHALLICDMPFGSFQISTEQAIASVIRVMKETGAEGVKIEGGRRVVEAVRHLTGSGVPVMGHLGLTPQSVHTFGGYGLRGKSKDEAKRMLDDAKALEAAGAFSIVLEKIPIHLAEEISKSISIPTLGIASGPNCDGQILVLHDMLGLTAGSMRFVRKYLDGAELIKDACARYSEDVRNGKFPTESEAWQG